MQFRASVWFVFRRCLMLFVLLTLTAACSASARFEVSPDAAAPNAVSAIETPEAGQPEEAPPDESQPDESRADDVQPDQRGITGEPAEDRIVVATASGAVYLVDPDGGDRLDLTTGPEVAGLQPVWSPDGRRIAWSERSVSGFSIASTNADGSDRRQALTPFSGYYGYWNPTSTQLGFLGNAAPGTGLVLDAGDGSALESVIDSDTFYYFSWSPDGSQWVVHSGSGFSIVSLDGTRRSLDLTAAPFRAPTWTPDGQLLLAVATTTGNVIARVDPVTLAFESLIDIGAAANFTLDPTGRFLAIELLGADAVDEDGITVSFQPASRQSGPPVAELVVYELATGETTTVLNERSGGFWWSPDGDSLAILVTDEEDPTSFAQWLIWRSDGAFRTGRFTVTPIYASTYVPFFDQFAQSVTPWSPDSSQFVYAGFDDEGRRGVFVQEATPDSLAQRIADEGAVAFWSPT